MGMSEQQLYVPANLAIEAMRDNGYKNTAYAVAELIDNSLQADASHVELICIEKEYANGVRRTRRMHQIAVIDNGAGMDSKVLNMALQFGNGTRLDKKQRTGIGRFGMGLPASSISQCQKVEIWSWQNTAANALYTYLDVNEVKNGVRTTVPDPIKKPIPSIYQQIALKIGETGTLVVWSDLDRLMWSKAKTLMDNSEHLIGRMYRKFLNEGTAEIRMVAVDYENTTNIKERYALPNDPGYLMQRTSCPAPYDKVAMFEPFPQDHYELKHTIDFFGEEHDIFVRYSYAKDEARSGDQAGNKPYGKHAASNIGISVVRAGRELDLDQTLVIQYDTRERWWGIEVDFPPSLDELMGVTNNKQTARNFADIMKLDIETLIKAGKTYDQIKAELEEEGDPRAPLIEVVQQIKNQLGVIRKLIIEQTKGKTKNKRHEINNSVEKKATDLTNERKQSGFYGLSDKDETKSAEERKTEITNELVDSGVEEDEAQYLAATTVSNSLKYLFAESSLESDAFFTVRPKGGSINIILNRRHPAYDQLVEVLEEETDNCDPDELNYRLKKASDGLRLLLMAWARYEDELPDGPRKDVAQETRADWGRVAKNFLKS